MELSRRVLEGLLFLALVLYPLGYALVTLTLSLAKTCSDSFYRHQALRQRMADHSITIEESDSGGYQVVE